MAKVAKILGVAVALLFVLAEALTICQAQEPRTPPLGSSGVSPAPPLVRWTASGRGLKASATELKRLGEYRTRQPVLTAYDQMAKRALPELGHAPSF